MLYRKRDEEQEETIPPHPRISGGERLGLGEVVRIKRKKSSNG